MYNNNVDPSCWPNHKLTRWFRKAEISPVLRQGIIICKTAIRRPAYRTRRILVKIEARSGLEPERAFSQESVKLLNGDSYQLNGRLQKYSTAQYSNAMPVATQQECTVLLHASLKARKRSYQIALHSTCVLHLVLLSETSGITYGNSLIALFQSGSFSPPAYCPSKKTESTFFLHFLYKLEANANQTSSFFNDVRMFDTTDYRQTTS